MSVSNEPLCGQ